MNSAHPLAWSLSLLALGWCHAVLAQEKTNMHMLGIVMAPHEQFQPTYQECINRFSSGSYRHENCIWSEYEYQDSRLNRIYGELMYASPEETKAELRNKQRLWLSTRNSICRSPKNAAQVVGQEKKSCLLNLTTLKAIELEKLAKDIPSVARSIESAQHQTQIRDSDSAEQLLGSHRLNLQWIGDQWEEFGDLIVTNEDGVFAIRGWQQKDGDFLEMKGRVLVVESKQFSFQGEITTHVSHQNNGLPCARTGTMTFRVTGTRRYWRLKESASPCATSTDYVDIFMR